MSLLVLFRFTQAIGALLLANIALSSIAFAFPADFDGDGKTDLVIFRPNEGGTGQSTWYVWTSTGGCPSMNHTGYGGCQVSWGLTGDIPITGDYNVDGKSEMTVIRPSGMLWYIRSSINAASTVVGFGQTGDQPDEGDFNGDGISDIAVYRPSEDKYYVRYFYPSTGGVSVVSISMYFAAVYGSLGTTPTSGNYLGNGTSELGYYLKYYDFSQKVRWAAYYAANNVITGYGAPTDDYSSIPVVGNYLGGAGSLHEYTRWHPYEGGWNVVLNNGSTYPLSYVQWGLSGDVPVSGDYDGDGVSDYAVWRPGNGGWYIKTSTGSCAAIPTATSVSGGCLKQWGVSTDIPVQ